jgi:3-hydroxyacyl-CoA dehydrogenase/enoyl-CoA hydratase/3-hydroxybutyryl-CoA epimerase
MFKTLKYNLGDDGIAVVTIDVPNSNANVIGEDMGADFTALIAQIKGDDKVKGVVITSAKNDFMAGGDLKAMVEGFNRDISAEEAYAIATSFSPQVRALETCGKPVVAAINGPAMGGGLELALGCHYRVMANNPKAIVGLPEVTLGLMPGAGGSQRLPRMIGVRAATPLILQGTPLNAEKALKAGIVNAVVEPDQLVAAAKKWILDGGEGVQPWDKKGFQVPGGAGFADASLGDFYNLAATQIAKDTNRNLPAPLGALTAISHGTAVPIDAGLQIEAVEFAKLIRNPVAVNMVRTLFVSKGELEKLKARPAGIEPAQLKTIGVIGAGLMGGGVAQVSAQAGLNVVLIDATAEQAAAGKQRLADAQAKLIAKGRTSQEKVDAFLARITPAADYAALKDCDLVVEAVFEDPHVKGEVFKKLQAVLRADAIIASNTSAIPITKLAEGVQNPERFIGLHFFSPVDRMALLEIIKGEKTSDKTLAHALDYTKLLRKTPIVVNDGPGFFTTRTIGAYISEAIGMVSEGISPVLIDNCAKAAGYPVGPLQMIDELTLDLSYHANKSQQELQGAAWDAPYSWEVLRKFCEDLNRKGRRFGAGFYDYVGDKRVPFKGITEVYPRIDANPEEVKSRMLFAEAMEAVRAFEEGKITDPAEGDVGALIGIGFPAYTGGPFALIDTVGIANFVAKCDELADKYGKRYRPSAWLRDRAAKGVRFYPRKAG